MGIGKRLGKIRGNPLHLARIATAAVLVAAAALLWWHKADVDDTVFAALLGAISAVALSYFTDLISDILAAPDLSKIPLEIYESAEEEVNIDVGYYRTKCLILIKLTEHNGQYKLRFTMESEIRGRNNGSFVMRARIEPPEGTELYGCTHHKINGREVGTAAGGLRRIDKGDKAHEYIESNFRTLNGMPTSGISDEHRWLSPVSPGFTVFFSFPNRDASKYKYHLKILRGHRRDDIPPTGDPRAAKRFVHTGSLFSHQGFFWSIETACGTRVGELQHDGATSAGR